MSRIDFPNDCDKCGSPTVYRICNNCVVASRGTEGVAVVDADVKVACGVGEDCAKCKSADDLPFGVTRSCSPMHIPACSLACAERIAERYTHARIWLGGSLSPETTHPNYRRWADEKGGGR